MSTRTKPNKSSILTGYSLLFASAMIQKPNYLVSKRRPLHSSTTKRIDPAMPTLPRDSSCSNEKKPTFDFNRTPPNTGSQDPYPGFQKTTSPNAQRSSFDSTSLTSEVVPPFHDHRTLVLCFDGTGMLRSSHNLASIPTHPNLQATSLTMTSVHQTPPN